MNELLFEFGPAAFILLLFFVVLFALVIFVAFDCLFRKLIKEK